MSKNKTRPQSYINANKGLSSCSAAGSKKLSEFLIGAKVDPKKRKRVAVLCDQLGPIWIIGHRIDDRVKLTELTKRVLHLRARPLEPL